MLVDERTIPVFKQITYSISAASNLLQLDKQDNIGV